MKLSARILLCAIGTLCIAVACQVHNSVSSDQELFGDESPTGSETVKAAREVIKSRCANCHVSFLRYSQTQWVANGYVVPGSPETSLIYSRLRGAGVGGKENMPIDTALGTEELRAIYEWIEALS